MTFTSPCAHTPILPINMTESGEGTPVAQDGIGHNTAKTTENDVNMRLKTTLNMKLKTTLNMKMNKIPSLNLS